MDDANWDGTPADAVQETDEVTAAWAELEAGVAAYVATMVDPDDELLIELPDHRAGERRTPYIRVSNVVDGLTLRVEIPGNSQLSDRYRLGELTVGCPVDVGWQGEEDTGWCIEVPVTRAEDVASHVVWSLRDAFQVFHPHLLTRQASGPAAADADVLGLCATVDVPEDDPQPPNAELLALAIEPGDRDDLLGMVAAVLRDRYDEEPTVDDDGDFVLLHLDQPVWVRVRKDEPAVEIMSCVVHDVRSRRATAVETGLLNRDHLWVRWTMRQRTVWQTIVLPGVPFVPIRLVQMLDHYLHVMSATRDDLALRLGGKAA